MQILKLSDEQLLTLIVIEPFSKLIWRRKFTSSTILLWIYQTTLFLMRHWFVTIKIPSKQSNLSFKKKKDTFKKYHKSNNNIQLLQRLKFLQEKLNSFISVSVTSSVSVTLRIWTLRRSIYRNNYILYTREINFFVRIYIFCPPFFCTVRRKFRQMQLR